MTILPTTDSKLHMMSSANQPSPTSANAETAIAYAPDAAPEDWAPSLQQVLLESRERWRAFFFFSCCS